MMQAAITFATPAELADSARRDRFLAMLSSEEKARLSRLQSESKRDLFLLAHGLLRTSLSEHADVTPDEWQFATGAHGRPEIAAPQSPLRFNLSHTSGLAVCAVSSGCEVGIDVEDISRQHDPELARRFFSPREQRDLQGLAGSDQRVRFYQYWTLKEAYLKARGLGLSIPLEAFSFYRDGDGEWRIEVAATIDDDSGRWTFRSWRIGATHQSALALTMKELPSQP